jgi:hypothetical protein
MFRPRIVVSTLLLAAAALPGAPPAQAQRAHIEILVLSMPNRDRIGTLRPGETLDLEEGQTVRLRMSVLPTSGGTHYPSARYAVISGAARLSVEATNQEVGTFTITGLRVDNPRHAREQTTIRYEILDRKLNLPSDLAVGTVGVRVWQPEAPPSTGGSQQPSPGDVAGVVLYVDSYYRGGSQSFTSDQVHDLRSTMVGNDHASSVRIQPGCTAVLYSDINLRGTSLEITGDVPDLGRTRIGNDAVSSLTLDCSGRSGRWPAGRDRQGQQDRGVTLYEHEDFAGTSETFDGDVRDLRGTRIGQDRASSVRVDPGCQAVLYGDVDFRGDSISVTSDLPELGRTRVGNDSVSSLTVDCRRRWR